jgi:hypothetical protein
MQMAYEEAVDEKDLQDLFEDVEFYIRDLIPPVISIFHLIQEFRRPS